MGNIISSQNMILLTRLNNKNPIFEAIWELY